MKKNSPSQTKRNVTPPTLTKRFKSFLGKKNHPSRDDDSENWDDDAPSRPLVRFLVVLLLLQLVVIGGILLRGYFTKNGLASPTEKFQPLKLADSSAGAKAKPAAPKTTEQQTATPAPLGQLPTTATLPPTGNLPGGSRMTGSTSHPLPASADSGLIDEPSFGAQGAIPLPSPAPSAAIRSTATKRVTHLVLSGDTWESIAQNYGCTVQELKTANKGAVLRNNLSLVIPPPPGVVQAVVVDENAPDLTGSYTIKKGDNLYRIAKQHKTTVQKIMKANNFTDADARKLKPGQVIKLN